MGRLRENIMSEDKKIVRNQAERATRKKRGSFGATRTKLGVDVQLEGYKMYWMNDEVGRITDALDYGWEHVTSAETTSSGNDEKVCRLVGKKESGEPLYAYLMKIRQDWYEEDQSEQQKVNDAYDAAIRRGSNERVEGGYIPSSGIKLTK